MKTEEEIKKQIEEYKLSIKVLDDLIISTNKTKDELVKIVTALEWTLSTTVESITVQNYIDRALDITDDLNIDKETIEKRNKILNDLDKNNVPSKYSEDWNCSNKGIMIKNPSVPY